MLTLISKKIKYWRMILIYIVYNYYKIKDGSKVEVEFIFYLQIRD